MISSRSETFNYSGPRRCWRHGKTDCELCFIPQPATLIHCSECPSHVQAGEFTAEELISDGWLLEPVVYCPRCGPDDQKEKR